MKSRKAPGPGGINTELLKCGTRKLFRILTHIFNKYINGDKIPEEWKMAHVTPIYKKGNKFDCWNY
jgi:hypothetical protein